MKFHLFAASALMALAMASSAGSQPAGEMSRMTNGGGEMRMLGGTGKDPFTRIYGHDVRITGDNNKTEHLWIQANHTFTWQGPMGERGHGQWSLAQNGTVICLAPLTSLSGKELARPGTPRCAEIAGNHGVGETWEQHNDKGEHVRVEVRS